MTNIHDINDDTNGVRFNWNVLPSTRLEATQLLTPIGCLYTPLHTRPIKYIQIPNVPTENNGQNYSSPLSCSSCENYINPYTKIDRLNNMWWCPFCEKRTLFPDQYQLPLPNASNDQIPIELRQSSTTINYELPDDISLGLSSTIPLAFVYVIDTYQHVDEFKDESSSIQFDNLIAEVIESIKLLPNGSLVSIISFDEVVTIHQTTKNSSTDFTNEEFFGYTSEENKSIYDFETLFQDTKITRIINVKLNMSASLPTDWQESSLVKENYLVEITPESKSLITSYLETLKYKTTDTYKPIRSTGLSQFIIAYLLSQFTFKGFMGKVSIFTSGPGTLQPGRIVSHLPGSNIRSHHDILKVNAPDFSSSSKFYQVLGYIATGHSFESSYKAVNLVSNNITDFPEPALLSPRFSFDIYAGSLDQIGVYELKPMILTTCGQIFLCESFSTPHFKKLLKKTINQAIATDKIKYNCKLTVSTSPGMKVQKLISHGSRLASFYEENTKYNHLRNNKISDTIDEFDSSTEKSNFTNQWWFNKLHENDDTLAIYFEAETVSSSSKLNDLNGIKQVYIQYKLKYWNGRKWNLRITTIVKPTTLSILSKNQVKMTDGTMRLVNSKSSIIKERELIKSFDYGCWMILLSRLMINKIDKGLGYEDVASVIKKADTALVRLLHYFGGISIDQSNGDGFNPYTKLMTIYKMNENFKKIPSLMYNLRRNPQLINIFNSSPDETAYYHYLFMRANTEFSKIMIEPRSFNLNNDGTYKPTNFDASILKQAGNNIIIMDSVFNITIYYCQANILELHHSNNDEKIYDDNEDSDIRLPLDFIKNTLLKEPINRNIEPKYVLTQKGHSQARFLVARLNPEMGSLEPEGIAKEKGFFNSMFKKLSINDEKDIFKYDTIMTEEISLKNYYDGLVKLVKKFRASSDY